MQQYMINSEQINGNYITLNKEDLHHVFNVMRKKTNDLFYCVNFDNELRYLCQIAEGDKIIIIEELTINNELPYDLVLVYGLVKSDKLEFVLQKASELGVSKFIPLKTKHSIVKLADDKIEKKLLRWQKIVKEACEQAQRNQLMKISEPLTIAQLQKELCTVNLVAYEVEGKNNYSNKIRNHYDGKTSVLLVVGPEGGFDDSEISQLESLGIKAVSLGKRILRTETAALSACSIVADLME
jgi:16S rRNA (uracil1498-N3)-methyltransferase